MVIITGGWAICIGCFMCFDQTITDIPWIWYLQLIYWKKQFWCCPRVGQLHPIFKPHHGVFVWMSGPRRCDMKNPQLLPRLHLAWNVAFLWRLIKMWHKFVLKIMSLKKLMINGLACAILSYIILCGIISFYVGN